VSDNVKSFQNRTWKEAREAMTRGVVVILPVGSTEAHGPHLPLSTDVIISEEMSLRASDKLNTRGIESLVLPAISYSVTDFSSQFSGTISIKKETAVALIRDICISLYKQGARLIAVANSHLEPEHVASINEAIQAVVEKHRDRFIGFGSVPLQSVSDSIAIAEEAKSMGLKGLEIGNAVGDKPLDDPSFEPFFEAAQKLDLLLFVHPLEGGLDADDPLSPILGNVLQFTFRTTMMVERMIITGMFEKYPNLKLCLSHGGGLLAFNIWRLDHSYGLRADLQKQLPKKPSEYFKKLYFDTIVHSVAALRYLVQVAGSDRVVLGTDYPMAMGDFATVDKVMQLEISDAERAQLLGGNAARALNL